MAELEWLAQLRDQGIVSEEELTAKKKQLLGMCTGQLLSSDVENILENGRSAPFIKVPTEVG